MVLASAGLTLAPAVSWQLIVSFTYLMVDLTDCWLTVAAEVSGLCESYPIRQPGLLHMVVCGVLQSSKRGQAQMLKYFSNVCFTICLLLSHWLKQGTRTAEILRVKKTPLCWRSFTIILQWHEYKMWTFLQSVTDILRTPNLGSMDIVSIFTDI